MVGVGAHGHRHAEPAFGLCRDGGRCAPARTLSRPRRHLVAHPGARHAGAAHPVGVAVGQPGLRAAAVGGVGGGKEVPGRRIVGPERGHNPFDEGAGLFELVEVLRQPALVHGGDPGRLSGRWLRRHRQVNRLLIVEQLFFQHAHQRGAQLGGRRSRQRDAMPADVGGTDPGHDGVGLRQKGRRGAALARHVQAIGTEQVRVFRRGITLAIGGSPSAATRGQENDQDRHRDAKAKRFVGLLQGQVPRNQALGGQSCGELAGT